MTHTDHRRAEVHAALADPTRLRVVDRLALTDLSPGELARDLGLTTSLLAHHLKVLEGAAVVRRSRSEGDGRRSYVRVVLDDPVVAALAGAGTGAGLAPVTRVVFVCTHNSARSHLAAAAFQQVCDVPVASAGTHPAPQVHPVAAAVAARHDLDLRRRRPAHVSDVLRPDDLVVSVCDTVHEQLAVGNGSARRSSARPSSGLHWSVPDPVRAGTDSAFEAALVQITARVDRLGHAVTSSLERSP